MIYNLETTVCLTCRNGLHLECWDLQPIDGETDRVLCCCSLAQVEDVKDNPFGTEKGRPLSNPEDITDVLSTGRKRAATLYPVYDGMVCEWAGLSFAGGGVEPIIGCRGNLLYNERGKYARHHGPDKNVLENGPANVHRICYTCHNRWHALNNEYYGKRPANGQPFIPVGDVVRLAHDPITLATAEEIDDNEEFWATRKADRITEED